MGFLIIILVLCLSGWSLVVTIRRLKNVGADRNWWVAFGVCTIIGIVLGCLCAFMVDYHVTPKMRFSSFPLPLAFFKFEDGAWVDYVAPRFVVIIGILANILAVTAVANLPVFFISLRAARMRSVANKGS
jgi:hypothetical protein